MRKSLSSAGCCGRHHRSLPVAPTKPDLASLFALVRARRVVIGVAGREDAVGDVEPWITFPGHIALRPMFHEHGAEFKEWRVSFERPGSTTAAIKRHQLLIGRSTACPGRQRMFDREFA